MKGYVECESELFLRLALLEIVKIDYLSGWTLFYSHQLCVSYVHLSSLQTEEILIHLFCGSHQKFLNTCILVLHLLN